jgi:hypothetical protein
VFARFALAMEFVAIGVMRFEAHHSLGIAAWRLMQLSSIAKGAATCAALNEAAIDHVSWRTEEFETGRSHFAAR